MIPTWGTSTGRSQASLVPSLLLDFSYQTYLLNGSAFAAFGGSPGITFSRGTNATLIDSTGTLTYAPSNMFLNSESFAAVWFPTGLAATPVVSNAIAAPDGTITADKIVENNIDTAHYLAQSTTFTASTSYNASIYVKAAERQYIQIILTAGAFGSALTAGFDLSGSGSTVTSAGSTSLITPVGDGWYRCSIKATATISALAGVQIRLANSLSTTPASYQGDGTSGLYFWGAQIGAVTYETTPRAYNSTTPKNFFARTEELTTSPWVNAAVVPTVNAVLDPNGFLTAEKFAATSASVEHYVRQTAAITTGTTFTASVYVKSAGKNSFRIRCLDSAIPANGFLGAVDTSTGLTTGGAAGAGTFTSVSATNVGNGWFRLSVTGNAGPTAASIIYDLFILAGNQNSLAVFAGNDIDGGYFWGAQLSDSASLDPYVYNPAAAPTSTAYYGPRFEYSTDIAYGANLIPYAYPQDFNSANWTKARATAPATIATADPTGTYTAYKLTEDNSVNLSHLIQWQGVSTAVTVGTQYTVSGYAKAAERTTIAVSFGTDNGAFTTNGGRIDITPSSSGGTGAVSVVSGAAPIVTDAGNGWWRFSVTATATATAQFAFRVTLVSGGITNYTGDGTSGVYIWGAQLTESAAAVPFFYYPYTPLGLLIEEARTNLIFPSDANTGWTASPGSSVVATANAAISPDGTTNATKLATNDTATSGHLWFKTYTGAINTTYCGSVYLKAEEYTRAEVSFGNTGFASTTTGALFDLAAGTVVITGGGSTATITPVGNGWYRCSVTATSDADGGAYVFTISPKPASVTTIGASYTSASTGLGVYVYGVQVEAGGFATSFVPTVSASATRSADVATMVGNNFSNWYNQTNGTIAAKYDNVSTVSFPAVYGINDGTAATRINTICSTTTANRLSVVSIGSTQAEFAFSNYVVGTTATSAIALAENNFAGSVDGATVQTDIMGTMPVVTQLQLGTQVGGLNSMSGHIKAISYYNARLPDAQLQVITA